MSNIIARHTSTIIPYYNIGDCTYLENMLSVWDSITFANKNLGFIYDEDKKELRIPRSISLDFLEKKLNKNIVVDKNHDPFDVASFRMKTMPRNDLQRNSISFLLGEGKFDYTKKASQLSLNLETGDGKTYCTIAAMSILKCKTIIFSHKEDIKEQWLNSLLTMTDIDKDLIFNIDGSKSIKKLLKMDKLPYKVFLVNHRTISEYAKKNGNHSITELFNKLRVGLKVYDEAHLSFTNIITVDMYTNTKKTFYITSTFNRSDYKEDKVFNTCFKNICKFGKETRDSKRKHIIHIAAHFNSKPNLQDQVKCKKFGRFDKNYYVDYQLSKDYLYRGMIEFINLFKDKDGKLLIIIPKKSSVDLITKLINEDYPDKVVIPYHSGIPQEIKDKKNEADIICSTRESIGTGVDIPGLRFIICTEPYSSQVSADQIPGRLREFAEDKFTFYVELIDTGFDFSKSMHKRRLKHFEKKCFRITHVDLDI